ncbi:histidine phosphatase family protein [Halobacillus locisalis]|uniref:Histidine phosphatase family protein n=1 Tax=Halobacillus locisalis TaxID=220753 RepID=A0A838CUN0_9BACI|nr:histidine phosphatase family protein [Halobacillus locisalis]MBA2175690.1 histidine phosphatase family protein [Halobacillus locisalis]
MTRLGIIRHGSTLWNKERRAQGSSNIPLDEEGIQQARKLADRLKCEPWEKIYVSPLTRARQTAEVIKEQLQIPLQEDSRLEEVGGGQIEGTTEQERVDRWGEDWRSMELGLEKKDDVLNRGMSFLEDILAEHEGGRILIVSHGALISHLVKEMTKEESEVQHIRNTSLTEVIREKKGWHFERFNCTSHLD